MGGRYGGKPLVALPSLFRTRRASPQFGRNPHQNIAEYARKMGYVNEG